MVMEDDPLMANQDTKTPKLKEDSERLEEFDNHIKAVVKAIVNGRLLPFLGAGASLCGRPHRAAYERGRYLPNATELAMHLAESFSYPSGEPKDLLRVAQYVFVAHGSAPLYEDLRAVFDADYPSTSLHQLLANIPGILRTRGYPPRYQLIVTTNYDNLLERAFNAVNEPFDLVTYVAEGANRGKFRHQTPDGTVHLIEQPNEYPELTLERQSVIMKIHGTVDRAHRERDSFIITEDHYIDYLTHVEVSQFVPVMLAKKLSMSNFLFLGYSLADWNLRVILHRIWGEQQERSYQPWAIQLNPKWLDEKFWKRRGVDIINKPLGDYATALKEGLEALPSKSGVTS